MEAVDDSEVALGEISFCGCWRWPPVRRSGELIEKEHFQAVEQGQVPVLHCTALRTASGGA